MPRPHFCAGVLVAPFLPTTAVTGLLYADSFRAERLVYGHEPTVPAGERELPASVQVAAARKARPEGTAVAVRPAPAAGATTRVPLSYVERREHRRAAHLARPGHPVRLDGRGRRRPRGRAPAADSAYVVRQIRRSRPEQQDAVAVDPATGRGTVFGRPVPCGAWAQVPPYLLVPALAAVAVLGRSVPLLGIPLVRLFAVDILLGEVAHRCGRRTYGSVSGVK
ncbi:PepSY domain-containing protein [Streptomyces olivaceoviridis]